MPPKLPDSMPWQIYQAYLRGPAALLRLFEAAFGRQALYGPPNSDMQQREIAALSADIGRLKAQIERLQAEVSELLGRNFQLGRRNTELEALIAKDSHNSSRPPSTDPPWAKRTKSLRRPSSRRPGGQVEHRGETLRLAPHALGGMMLSTCGGFGVEDSDTSSWKNDIAPTASCARSADSVIFASI